ncbi:MAG: methyl-accepting chemotaxis protein [Deltaproteobacteria bacterium]
MRIQSLRAKFYIGLLLLLSIIGTGTYIGYRNLKEMNGFLQLMYNEKYANSMLAANLKARINEVRAVLVAMTGETDKIKIDRYHETIKEISSLIDRDFLEWLSQDSGAEIIATVSELKSTWEAFRNTRDTQIIPFIYEGRMQEAKELALGIQAERYKKMVTLSTELIKVQEAGAKGLMETARRNFRRLVITSTALALFTVIGYLAVSWYFMRTDFIAPLSRLADYARLIAEGDISKETGITVKNEIGDLTNAMNDAVKGLRDIILKTKGLSANVAVAVKKIEESAHSIRAGSEQQSQTMRDISLSAERLNNMATNAAEDMDHLFRMSEGTSSSLLEMAASIEEVDGNVGDLTVTVGDVSISIEEIANLLKEVASGVDNISKGADETASSLIEIDASAMEIERNTKESAELSHEVAREGERGVKAMELTHNGMEKVKDSMSALAVVIDELGQRSKEIGKILNVIDDVAVETNLLALNAAILAAQAGEHGKSFGVVADEIRELSERTAVSTKEITSIVSGIQGQIKRAVVSAEEGMSKVIEGEKLSTETIAILMVIMERFKTFQNMSLKIAEATKEQASGSKRVTQNLEAITHTIHQMARATQEQYQGSTQIVKSVEKMKNLVSHIKKATAEQAKGSKVIASNTEDVMKFAKELDALSSDLGNEEQKIAQAVEMTAAIAKAGFENATKLDEVVGLLKNEIDALKRGLDSFRLV